MQNPLLLILVVEDERLIQELAQEALSDGGFDTKTVSSGEEATGLLERDHAQYCALLTDIHLQGDLTGWDVAKRARELNPDIPVVYMTGAGANEWASHGVPNSIRLNKPFATAQIVTAISQLLNRTPPHE